MVPRERNHGARGPEPLRAHLWDERSEIVGIALLAEAIFHRLLSVSIWPGLNRPSPRARIKLTEIDGGRVMPHDWRREEDANAPLDSSQQVVLRTPWRA